MRVAIRADASASLGTGHLRRCLALGQALADCGAESFFVSRPLDEVAALVLRAQPFDCHWLREPVAAQGDDAAQSAQALANLAPDWVVVDHYTLGEGWHRAVHEKTGARIFVIDDLADRPLAPQLLLDVNLRRGGPAKYTAMVRSRAAILSGPRYALLDAAFAATPKHVVGETVASIGIFMGGADAAGACLSAVRACREVAGFQGLIEVVSSPISPRHQQLLALCAQLPATEVLEGLPNLADFFRRHDLQIGAGGGAALERCCMGVPSLVCDVAPNQLESLPGLADAGAVVWVRGTGNLTQALGHALPPLLHNTALRRGLAERSSDLVDGLGAPRVAAVLCCAAGALLAARPAEQRDEKLLLDWANDPEVRAQGFHPERIAAQDHSAWFTARLADARRCRIFIVNAPNGVAVGQVRLERCDGGWEIGFSLDPAFRGLGLGQRLLLAGLSAGDRAPRLIGRVKPSNEASARVFRALGFKASRVSDTRGEHWLFSKEGALAQVSDNS